MDFRELSQKFPTQEKCSKYLEKRRWGNTPQCPYCESENTNPLAAELRHHCNGCRKSFSVTVGTIFHHSHIELQKWFMLMTLMMIAKKSLSSCQASRALRLRRPTARSMMIRIRKAMCTDQMKLLSELYQP
ncbi:MAG: IS1595 family transposase [Gammaproteobacteria bacterium]|nr:IS1595 family transposase [Gammaproteobacteria bacterium]